MAQNKQQDIADIGILDSLKSGKRSIERITNFFLLGYLLIAIPLDYVTGNKMALTYHIILFPLFFITFGLYLLKKERVSQIVLVSLLILSLIGSVIIIDYFKFFRYAIVLPISLAYIFWGTDKKKTTLNIFITVNILFALSSEIFVQPELSDSIEDLFITPFVYISFIFCYVVINWYFNKRLTLVLERLFMFKEISDFSNEGIAVKDEHDNYIFQNNTNEKILGYSVQELQENHQEMTLIKNNEAIPVEDGLKKDGVYEIKTKKGTTFIDFLSYNVAYQNKTKYVVEIKRDITEKHNLEQKLRDANLAKDKLFAIIAHDIKSPFNSILGISDFIVHNKKMLKDEIRYYIKQINSVAKTTYELLENLLGWALVQQNKIIVNTELINIDEFFKDQVDLYTGLAETKGIKITVGKITSKFIQFDPNMLHTVFRNLISNAIKYCSQGDRITLSATKNHSTITLAITDTGAGMTEEELNNLKSSRLLNDSKTGTQKEKGTGLGFVLCKEFIKRNDGELEIYSKLNEGTEIKINIPAST